MPLRLLSGSADVCNVAPPRIPAENCPPIGWETWCTSFLRLFFAVFAALPLGRIAQWLHLPIITGFLIIGIIEGPAIAGVVPKDYPVTLYIYIIQQAALSCEFWLCV